MAIIGEGTSQSFSYNGSSQKFVVPISGLYRLQVWGAGGGEQYGLTADFGMQRGHSTGYIMLKKGDILYVCCGGKGGVGTGGGIAGGYNGGGSGAGAGDYASGGGGCTHIARISGTLQSIGESRKNMVLIVAGGGGGYRTSAAGWGGVGGGLNGGAAGPSSGSYIGGGGGTQTKGGVGRAEGQSGSFGKGGNASRFAGGGGGGWYGGGAGYGSGGGGGSGYIGGVPAITFGGKTYSPATSNGVIGQYDRGAGQATITLIKKSFSIYLGDISVSGIFAGDSEITNIII